MRKKKEVTKHKQDAIDKLWRKGILHWKLKGKQKQIYDHFRNGEDDIVSCMISRQFGKSFAMCLIAIETCIETPGAIVKYACPTQKMVQRVIIPRVKDIIADCPVDMKPEWKTQEKEWLFPNGSSIQIAGTDNGNYDNLRGGSAHLCIADEAGFMDELETIIYSVLAPTTDTTDGQIYLASTPNDKDPNHDFHELFVRPLMAAGKLLKLTYVDSPLIDEKKKLRILSRYPGGEKNIKFRCEYLCELPTISETSVIPEFVDVRDEIVKELPAPAVCDFYTSMDLGFKDLTVALFAYYDHTNKLLVVLDEYVINGPDLKTNILNEQIRRKESLLFTDSLGSVEPTLRVMDNNNLMLINELSSTYDLRFFPTAKHNKEQAVDSVRRWVEQKKIIIHPRCKNLLYHIENAQWHYTRAGTYTGKFKNLKGNDSAGLLTSHADALDALIYLLRNIKTYNTRPTEEYTTRFGYKSKKRSKAGSIMNKIMNLGSKD